MKFIDIINSKMFLNGLMEIVAKKYPHQLL